MATIILIAAAIVLGVIILKSPESLIGFAAVIIIMAFAYVMLCGGGIGVLLGLIG